MARVYVRRAELEQLKDEFVKCRALGHAWYDFVPANMAKAQFGTRLSLRCERCRTERHDLVNWKGDVLSRDYRYIPEYTGLPKTAKGTIRLELLRRRGDMPVKPRTPRENARAANAKVVLFPSKVPTRKKVPTYSTGLSKVRQTKG